MAQTKDSSPNVWVFIETSKDTLAPVGLELLTPGRQLAELCGGKLVALVLGGDNTQSVISAGAYGADEVISIEGPEYTTYNTDVFTAALAEMVLKHKPETLLIGATDLGCDLAPRLSCRLNVGLVAHCIALDIDQETGNVVWTRPAYGSKLLANIICTKSRPQIGTIKPGVFKKPVPCKGRTCPVISERATLTGCANRVRLIETVQKLIDAATKLEKAEIVIGAGMGIGGMDGLALVQELADVLGAAVGVTRPVADIGWAERWQQIGQSGRTVSPKLYIGCGISGAMHHVCGIGEGSVIVAVNKDAHAPIFGIADYGIVGDLHVVLPAMITEIKTRKA